MNPTTSVQLPKVAIQFCVQCKWNLRAAYFAQELLQTFSNTLGEVSLIPVTGGLFTITVYHGTVQDVQETLIWDRKRDGGFPETKELKNRVRNIIDPEKDMGHVDRALKKSNAARAEHQHDEQKAEECEECRQAERESGKAGE